MSGQSSFALEVPVPDFLAAVDLQARLEATAQARVVSTPEGSAVIVAVPQSRLRTVLSSLADGYGLGEVELRVNRRVFTVHGHPDAGLKWRDAHGEELDNIEIGSLA
jgi:hypothetical protein